MMTSLIITARVKIYQAKIKAFLFFKSYVGSHPESILADLLAEYAHTHNYQNLFAYRLSKQLSTPGFNLFATLEDYFKNRSKTVPAPVHQFDALLLAYFYYYGDAYHYYQAGGYLDQYPHLKVQIFLPLEKYKITEKMQNVQQLLDDLGSVVHDTSYSAFKMLQADLQIPAQMIPTVVTTISLQLSNHFTQPSHLYPLLFHYAANNLTNKPLALRFPLTTTQRHAISQALSKLIAATDIAPGDVIDALFLLAPESDWPGLVANLMEVAQDELEVLIMILRSNFKTTKDMACMHKLVNAVLSLLNHDRSLFGIADIPQQYYPELLKNIMTRFKDPQYELTHTAAANIRQLRLTPEMENTLKREIYACLENKKYNKILRGLPALVDLFRDDHKIIELIHPCIRNKQLHDAIPISALLQTLVALNLNDTVRAQLIPELLTQLGSFYLMSQDNAKQLNLLCKTEADFLCLLDCYLNLFKKDLFFDKKRVLLAMSHIHWPTVFYTQKIMNAIFVYDDLALKRLAMLVTAKLPGIETYQTELTNKILELITHTGLTLSATRTLFKLYPENEQQDRIRDVMREFFALLPNIFPRKLEKLLPFPIQMDAVEHIQPALDHLVQHPYFLSQIPIINVTPDFIDILLDRIHHLHAQEIRDILVNTTPQALVADTTEKLIKILLKNPHHFPYYRALMQFPIAANVALDLLEKLLLAQPMLTPTSRAAFLLFGYLLGNIPYENRITIILALEMHFDKRPTDYAKGMIHLNKLKDTYLVQPLLLKQLASQKSVPDDCIEKVIAYRYSHQP